MKKCVANLIIFVLIMAEKVAYIVGKFIEPKQSMITITMHESLITELETLKENNALNLLSDLEAHIATIKECVNKAEAILRKQGAIYKWNKLNIVLECETGNNYYKSSTNTIVLSLSWVPAVYNKGQNFYDNLYKIHGIEFDWGTDEAEKEALEFTFWHEFGHYYDNIISHVNERTVKDIIKNDELRQRINSLEYYAELRKVMSYEEADKTLSYEYRMMPKEYYADRFAKRMMGK
jgi:hypothetical protein